jgi:hypothetical protein
VPGAEGDEPDLMATLAGTSRRVRPQYELFEESEEGGCTEVEGEHLEGFGHRGIGGPRRIHGMYFDFVVPRT